MHGLKQTYKQQHKKFNHVSVFGKFSINSARNGGEHMFIMCLHVDDNLDMLIFGTMDEI